MILRLLGILASLAACLLLGGCTPGASDDPTGTWSLEGADPQQWVVVTFSGSDEDFPLQVMDALAETEFAADEALGRSGLGMIDGNEIGDGDYQLFFVGADRHRMWEALEPVFEEAPVTWTRVELFESLEGEPDVVHTR